MINSIHIVAAVEAVTQKLTRETVISSENNYGFTMQIYLS